MLNLKTGRFFVGDGNILYPSMRKKEFFQTNFFIKDLSNEENIREAEEYNIKGYAIDDLEIDINIRFDCKNDFIDEFILKSSNLDLLLEKLSVKNDTTSVYPWGNVECKNNEVKIKFNNEKFIK